MSYRRLLVMGWVGVLALFTAPRSDAQPYLVKNINDGSGFGAWSGPEILGVANGHVIFSADDVEHGHETWATDGTPAGTRLLTDVTPGPAHTDVISRLGVVGDRLLFGARGQAWSTDGTPAGTVRLTYEKLGQSGPYQSAHPIGVFATPPRLLFTLYDPDLRDELWVSDGTPGGTHFVVGLAAAGPGVAIGGELVFEAGLDQLWRSDGTRAGTAAIRGFRTLEALTKLDDERAVFMADDEVSGREIWVTDGTAGGTRLVVDLRPGAPGSDPFLLRSEGGFGYAFFLVDDEIEGRQLWRTDGTSGGTFRLAPDLEIGFRFSVVDGLLFTTANDAAHGFELLVSDGTVAGTRLLDLCPGSCSSSPTEVTGTSIGFLFTAFDEAHGQEPWLTDGTIAGSRRLADLCPGFCDGADEVLADLGGRLVLLDSFTGAWVTDGTTAGTRPLTLPADLRIGFQLSVGVANGVAVFNAIDILHGEEPWRTDGTEAGTFLLGDLAIQDDASSNPAHFERRGAEVFFAASRGLDRTLWRSDGTESGTEPVEGLVSDGAVTELIAVGSDLFALTRRELRTELWRTDGTAGGTLQLFADDLPGLPSRREAGLAAAGGVVYVLGPGLWRSGRTPGSAQKLASLIFDDDVAQAGVGILDGRVYFSAAAGFSGGNLDLELWSTDGTPGGTRRVREIRPGSGASRPREFVTLGDRLYFLASVGLWRTDGTDAGTELVFEFECCSEGRILGVTGGQVVFHDGTTLWALSDDGGLSYLGDRSQELGTLGTQAAVPLRNRIFFVAEVEVEDGVLGGRLWSTDGTLAGTRPSPSGPPPGHLVRNLFPAGGGIALLVVSPLGGRELWVTDATPGGARRIAVLTDLEVNDFGLFEEGAPPIALGDQLLFNAATRGIGTELWGADLDASLPPFGLPAAPTDLSAEAWSESGVRLIWRDNSADEASFRITGATAEESLGGSVSVPAGTSSVIVQGLPPETPFTFTVAAVNAMGSSAASNEASAAPLPEEVGPCVADAGTLCLLGGRFAVSVLWRDQHNGGVGTGGALPFPGSDRTGLFWFFNPANVELIVKALDGRGVNGAFWSFYGALSDVEYWVTVVDTARRRARTYHNRPAQICGVGDTGAFPEASPVTGEASSSRAVERREDVPVVTWPYTAAVGQARSAAPEREKREDEPAPAGPAAGAAPEPGRRWRRLAVPAAEPPSPLRGAVVAGTCTPGPEALCLLGGRLRVEVFWQDQHNGGSGTGKAVPGTDKAGFFWFFNPANVELVVKALDGTGVNGHLWVFYGALSDVEYTIAVTDTVTGLGASYHNPSGEICGEADTEAF